MRQTNQFTHNHTRHRLARLDDASLTQRASYGTFGRKSSPFGLVALTTTALAGDECGYCGSDRVITECFDGDHFEGECLRKCQECGVVEY